MNSIIRTTVIKATSLNSNSLLFIESINVSQFDVTRFLNNLSAVIQPKDLMQIYQEQGLEHLKGILENNNAWEQMLSISQKKPYGITTLSQKAVEVLPLQTEDANKGKSENISFPIDNVANMLPIEDDREDAVPEANFFDIIFDEDDETKKNLPVLPGEDEGEHLDDFIF